MQGSSCSYRWWVHGSIIMPPLSPLQLFGGQESCIKEEPNCNELRKRNENHQVNLYTGGQGMEESGKQKPFHTTTESPTHVYCTQNLLDATTCTKHMLFFNSYNIGARHEMDPDLRGKIAFCQPKNLTSFTLG